MKMSDNWVKIFFTVLFVNAGFGVCQESHPNTILTKKQPFSRSSLESSSYRNGFSGISFLSPSRFSMRQSYSTSMSYSGGNSMSSGLYLNSLSYQLGDPLTFSIDLGIYTPFHSSVQNYYRTNDQPLMNSEFVIPRVGLDYRPNANTYISIQLLNLNASRTVYNPFGFSRSPYLR